MIHFVSSWATTNWKKKLGVGTTWWWRIAKSYSSRGVCREWHRLKQSHILIQEKKNHQHTTDLRQFYCKGKYPGQVPLPDSIVLKRKKRVNPVSAVICKIVPLISCVIVHCLPLQSLFIVHHPFPFTLWVTTEWTKNPYHSFMVQFHVALFRHLSFPMQGQTACIP